MLKLPRELADRQSLPFEWMGSVPQMIDWLKLHVYGFLNQNDTHPFCVLSFQNDMTTVVLKWEEMLMPLLQKYKLNITWGDQDLLNIIFHHNPG